KECFNLIFAPGFSTSETITDVSGRGVGMDVVKRNINQLRGAITIQSEKGAGTVFSIRLPLTLAIIDGMVICAGGDRFIIPKLSIVETFRISRGDIKGIAGHHGEMVLFRGEYVPFKALRHVIGLPGEDNSEGVVIILEDLNGERVAVYVSEIIGQQQVVIKNIRGIGNVRGITGGAIMSDGMVNLILDVSAIISMTKEKTLTL
ncbi:MAG: chemotaxis protein CheW, partial [Fibrobacterota bacterium]